MTTDTVVTAPASRSAGATVARLIRAELRLVLREPLVLAFVFAFPVVTVLVIAGSFAAEDAPDFGGIDPSDWYVSSYLAVIIAAIGLVMVPVHVAAYRERGVLRRFAAAGFPRWSFAVASIAVGVVLTLVGSAVMLAVAAPVYGLPPVDSPIPTVLALLAGAVTFTSIGLLIGSVVPNARAAQGIGLLAFFPSFLLGGGGPPPSVMGDGLRRVADLLPLTHVTQSIRDPWIGAGTGTGHLAIVLAFLAVSALGWWRAVRL
ncbi:MAG TPA: ABC transporter permease [Mycobacteriales bacterium]|nr:ABC transporter permease [Mycobacteriales bacterium]